MTHHTHAENEGKFVDRFERAVMQFVVLEKASQGEVTRENLEQTFKGNLSMKHSHLDSCLDTLVREKHLTKDGNKFRITDDGREDIHEVQRLAAELQNVASQRGGNAQTQQGKTQQQASGIAGTQLGTGGSGTSTTNPPQRTAGGAENRGAGSSGTSQPR